MFIFDFDYISGAPAAQPAGPRQWSYIGDAVESLYVRARLVALGVRRDISGAAIAHVCAGGQAAAVDALLSGLTEEEHCIYRRGHNAKIGVVPRGIDPALYSRATGWETLIGYLYCQKRYCRMEELLALAFDLHTEEK